ncbi:Cytochrome oxidase assembly protein 1 [Corchorus olitorius]|uniref:Cytochrome oxidase assembly protein 1 n=1 Tax=Corchorus olitorius TaxID=93759 RepID=A0A1R3KXY8_9ROSI|nr:Cytochrome oxidase assembly protein 1 [Corchorus olitorius]
MGKEKTTNSKFKPKASFSELPPSRAIEEFSIFKVGNVEYPSIFMSAGNSVNEEKSKPLASKAVSFVLITVTGGVALSALDDLSIYYGCSSKAMEKASKNQAIIDAIGEPIKKGPWYDASLAVAHKRQSVSCTFPVSGPQGSGVLQLKAVRNGGISTHYKSNSVILKSMTI